MIRIGVSGWSFDEWKETFYSGVPRRLWLTHYADHFPTVEINYTFRRTMAASTAEKWRETVGPGFRFSIKAHQRITHTARLKDPDGHLPHFLRSLEPLGEQLGPVLFQTPPHLPRNDERLKTFLGFLPDHLDPVFEFRNDSWANPETYDMLRNAGAGWVISETDDSPAPHVITGPVVYLRLRKEAYSDEELNAWASRLVTMDATDVWVYIKHEIDSPDLAARLTEFVATAEHTSTPETS